MSITPGVNDVNIVTGTKYKRWSISQVTFGDDPPVVSVVQAPAQSDPDVDTTDRLVLGPWTVSVIWAAHAPSPNVSVVPA